MAYKNTIRATALFTIALGSLVIVGWFFDIVELKSILPGYNSMKLNAATSLVVAGFILLGLTGPNHSKSCSLAAFFLTLLGIATLSQDIFGRNFGIDEWFILDTDSIEGTPGRMATTTALCISLLGVAFLLIKNASYRRIGQYIAHIVSLISFLVILGYFFKVPSLHRLSFFSSMSLHTSVGLLALSIGTSLINPELGLTGLFTGNGIGNRMARVLFPRMALVLILLSFIRIESHRLNLVSVEFGIALFAISFMLVGLGLIWDTSRRLNAIDKERSLAEEETRHINKNLGRLVAERTAELQDSLDRLNKKRVIIRRNQQLTKGIIDNAGSSIFVKDRTGRYILSNEKFAGNFGLTPESLRSKTAYDLFPKDLADSLLKDEAEMFRTGKLMPNLIFSHPINGVKSIQLMNKFPLFDESNEVYAIGGIATDVTELRKAEANLQAIFDSALVCIIETDTNGLSTHFNRGAEVQLGYRREEVINKHTPALIHLEEEVVTRGRELANKFGREIKGFDVFVEFARQGKHESREWTYVRKDGTQFPVQLVVTAIRDDTDIIHGFLGIATDISKLTETKENLEKLASQFQSKNSQLLNFAHITSHNLRSPVSNLNSLLSFYKESTDEEDKTVLFDKFEIVIKHLTTTLNELIESLKIQEDTGKSREELSFEDVLIKTEEILTGTIIETQATIQHDFTAADKISYPKSYLESIFLNLLSNALKYRSPDRTPTVRFKTSLEQGTIVLFVSDNGLGIDLQKHGDKLFGLNKTFHRHSEAKGVGLFITKTQIEAMGGAISADSEVNKGTTFKIVFGNS